MTRLASSWGAGWPPSPLQVTSTGDPATTWPGSRDTLAGVEVMNTIVPILPRPVWSPEGGGCGHLEADVAGPGQVEVLSYEGG